jgi:N4-(beta-N-acetylglucosaminyl)-L-asparaginase
MTWSDGADFGPVEGGKIMSRKMRRREFFLSTAAAGIAASSSRRVFGRSSVMMVPQGFKPIVIASANGHHCKNGGTQTCIEKAFSMIIKGADVLDAVIAGVNIVELDPEDTSVGYGGLPNADGVVQLDSCCMHGPLKRAGGVAALEGVRTPSLVARAVMDNTDHHLLVGKGAQSFARNLGFKIEDDLNTDASRKAWLEWKRRTDADHYIDPKKRVEAGLQVARRMADEGLIDIEHIWGTINCNGMNAKGEICGVTTTSGMAFKIPGRTGDSPILGAGLYVDGKVGVVGSTGRGEANLYNLTSFLVVEALRKGMHPKDAGMEGLKRIKENTIEKRLRKENGDPNFGISFYILNAKGEHAGVAMFAGDRVKYAVCTESGPALFDCDGLLPGSSTEP